MATTVRRLGPSDGQVLALLARDDADFDIDDRGGPRAPLDDAEAETFFTDPCVRAWVAEDDATVVGFLYGHAIRKRARPTVEVLLYEIGVRAAYRRRGVGRALVAALLEWSAELGARETWVLADNPEAIDFYRACGFEPDEGSAVMLSHRRAWRSAPMV